MNNTINENILDPINETLCKEIFTDEVMKSKIKSAILDPIYKWLDKYKYPFEKHVKSIFLIGSSAGYQYTDTSDVDVSVETDIPPETIKKIWKELPNGNNLPDTKHPVNYYLTSDLEDVEESDSAYDILKDTWKKKVDKEALKNKIPFSYVLEVTKFFTSGVDNRINELEADKLELDYLRSQNEKENDKDEIDKLISQKQTEIKSDYDAIAVAHSMLKAFRKEGFRNGNPYRSIDELELKIDISTPNGYLNNTVYKMVEKLGYFDKLDKLEEERSKLIDKKI